MIIKLHFAQRNIVIYNSLAVVSALPLRISLSQQFSQILHIFRRFSMPPKVNSGADGLPAVRDKGEQKEGAEEGWGAWPQLAIYH